MFHMKKADPSLSGLLSLNLSSMFYILSYKLICCPLLHRRVGEVNIPVCYLHLVLILEDIRWFRASIWSLKLFVDIGNCFALEGLSTSQSSSSKDIHPLTLRVHLLAVGSHCNDFSCLGSLPFLSNHGYIMPAGFIFFKKFIKWPFKCWRNCVCVSLVECKKSQFVEFRLDVLSQT